MNMLIVQVVSKAEFTIHVHTNPCISGLKTKKNTNEVIINGYQVFTHLHTYTSQIRYVDLVNGFSVTRMLDNTCKYMIEVFIIDF